MSPPTSATTITATSPVLKILKKRKLTSVYLVEITAEEAMLPPTRLRKLASGKRVFSEPDGSYNLLSSHAGTLGDSVDGVIIEKEGEEEEKKFVTRKSLEWAVGDIDTGLPIRARAVLDAAIIRINSQATSKDCKGTALIKDGLWLLRELDIDPHDMATAIGKVSARGSEEAHSAQARTTAAQILAGLETPGMAPFDPPTLEILGKLLTYLAGRETLEDVLDEKILIIEGRFVDWKKTEADKIAACLAIADAAVAADQQMDKELEAFIGEMGDNIFGNDEDEDKLIEKMSNHDVFDED